MANVDDDGSFALDENFYTDFPEGYCGHQTAFALMGGKLGTALVVTTAHTIAMATGGGIIASLVYRWLGLRFVSRTWFNLDVLWALSLVAVGSLGVVYVP